jgi:hypothetical protein
MFKERTCQSIVFVCLLLLCFIFYQMPMLIADAEFPVDIKMPTPVLYLWLSIITNNEQGTNSQDKSTRKGNKKSNEQK